MELLIVVTVIAIIVGIAVPFVADSISKSREAQQEALTTVLNQAKTRAILRNLDGIRSEEDWENRFSGDMEAAITFLVQNNLIEVR